MRINAADDGLMVDQSFHYFIDNEISHGYTCSNSWDSLPSFLRDYKKHMIRKTLYTAFILFFTLSFSFISAFGNICLCGDSCMCVGMKGIHAEKSKTDNPLPACCSGSLLQGTLQNETHAKKGLSNEDSCTQLQGSSCACHPEISEFHNDMAISASPTLNQYSQSFFATLDAALNDYCTNHLGRTSGPQHPSLKQAGSIPIYLQTLSLLC